MGLADDHVVAPVAVDVLDEHGDAGVDRPVLVEGPGLLEVSVGGSLVPAVLEEQVIEPVAAEVAQPQPVTVARLSDDDAPGDRLGLDAPEVLDLPGHQRPLLDPAADQPLGDAVAVEIGEPLPLVLAGAGLDQEVLLPEVAQAQTLRAGVLVPVDLLEHEAARDHVRVAVSVDVVDVVAVGHHVAVPVLDQAQRPGREGGGGVPVATRDHVQPPVPVDIGEGTPLIHVHEERLSAKPQGPIASLRESGAGAAGQHQCRSLSDGECGFGETTMA